MEGIKDRVAVVGMGCTKFGERWDADGLDLMVEACYEAYEDAGIGPNDIQAAWLWALWAASAPASPWPRPSSNYIPITRVENACATATDAFRNACYAVAAGIYDIALAAGVRSSRTPASPGWPSAGRRRRRWSRRCHRPLQFRCHPLLSPLRHPVRRGKADLAQIAVKNHWRQPAPRPTCDGRSRWSRP
jgi:acetyl-CoA C-acetyltransferase